MPLLPPLMFATVWWQVAAVPRLPELKLADVNTIGLVQRPVQGALPPHAGHEPPQSIPVSVPFWTPSLQVEVAVMPTAADVVVAPALSCARAVNEWLAGPVGTVQLTLYNFSSQYTTQYNLLFMDILLITIPPLIPFLFFNRQIVAGLTSGAIKG